MSGRTFDTLEQVGFCSSFAYAVQQHVLAKGVDCSSVMAAMEHLNRATNQPATDRIAAKQLSAGLNEAVRWLGDEQTGWRAGNAMALSRMGALGFAMMTAPRGIDALQLFESLQWLVSTEWQTTHEPQGSKILVKQSSTEELPSDYPFWSFLVACRMNFLRGACGHHLTPLWIEVPCKPPADALPMENFLGAPVRYRCATYQECLPSTPLLLTNPQSSPDIHQMMQGVARRQLQASLDEDGWLIHQLKRAVAQALHRGESPTMQVLSSLYAFADASGKRLNIRQVQRRLMTMNCTFRGLVAEVKRERALMQLRSTQRPLAAIAAEAGYSEPSAFHRAVRRWTGHTPMAIRESGANVDGV